MQNADYKAPPKKIWKGRDDGEEALRVHHIIEMGRFGVKEQGSGLALLGYASDIGAKRNQGRAGAALGPASFRKAFANIPLLKPLRIKDFGDLIGKNLEHTQENFKIRLKELLQRGYFPFGVGGSHDMSFPHYQALAETFPEQVIGIINLDAHLDLRVPEKGSNSGSSFYQIQHYLKKKPFHYLCIGAQGLANTADLWKRLKTKAITAEEIVLQHEKAVKELSAFLKKVDKVYFTICLDVFSAALCPGVSAPSSWGLTHYDVLPLIRLVKQSGKMLSFDIAELNPKFDVDGRTAKFAAMLAMEIIC